MLLPIFSADRFPILHLRTLLDKAVENGLAQRTADGWMPTLEGLFRGEVL